jgi:rare lipoprotein A (peptidoglycan hydrolase)
MMAGHALSPRGAPVCPGDERSAVPRVRRRTPRTLTRPRVLGVTGAVVLASLLAACSGNPKPKAYAFPPPEKPAVGTVVEGVASWYGPGYDGNKTSSGEVFDQDALTGAHAYWAFGTHVKVTFPVTGKSVVVRINDRFPSHKGRAIDLSRGAARAIGLIGPGTGPVRLEVVE